MPPERWGSPSPSPPSSSSPGWCGSTSARWCCARSTAVRCSGAGGWAGGSARGQRHGSASAAPCRSPPCWRSATAAGGVPFPDRNLLVFITCVVILVTILVQGLTLPAVVRWARFPPDTQRLDELQLARRRATDAALAALPELADRLGIGDSDRDRVRTELERHRELTDGDGTTPVALGPERRLRLEIVATKRGVVTDLRDHNEIDDIVLREVQAALDLEEARLLGPPPTV